MKCNGIELQEFKSDKAVVFDPPEKMLVWDEDDDDASVIPNEPVLVCAYIPTREMKVITSRASWRHCAEIPEKLKPRRATNLELVKWLAQGNGQVSEDDCISVWMTHTYTKNEEHKACDEATMVRKWDDTEWHEPTADYMGLEG